MVGTADICNPLDFVEKFKRSALKHSRVDDQDGEAIFEAIEQLKQSHSPSSLSASYSIQ